MIDRKQHVVNMPTKYLSIKGLNPRLCKIY